MSASTNKILQLLQPPFILMLAETHLCVYCSGSHAPSICDVVTGQQKQLAIVKQKGYALNV